VAALGSGLFCERLNAELACVDNPFGGRTCEAGIDPKKMDTAYASQEHSKWCWAACLEMVFTYWGHPLSQPNIVRQTWGAVVNMPAQPIQIVHDLNRSWVDDDEDSFDVVGDTLSANAVTASQDLAAGYPLILGSLGHAMVLTAITYEGIPNTGMARVIGATVRDPWPGQGRRRLSAQEYMGTLLLARIRIS